MERRARLSLIQIKPSAASVRRIDLQMGSITERIDRITLLTQEYRSGTPPVPRSVKIELTARCDFQCFFCASSMRLRDKADIDEAFYRRVLKEMRALGVEEVGLFYLGESFLYRWLPEAIRYDEGQLARMEAAVQRILPYVDEHYWLPLYGQAGLTSGARGTRPTAGNQGRVGALRKPLPCWSLFTEGHITFDGRLSACCFDHDGRFDMGDLNTETFMQAWHSEPFQKLRRANLAEDVRGTACEKCIAYDD